LTLALLLLFSRLKLPGGEEKGKRFPMSEEEIKGLIWRIALEAAEKGPGWSQEGVVLREAGQHIFGKNRGLKPDLQTQQMILDAWHELFTEKKLGWGYDLDNPSSPFFHVR
jgi:hypothetical protein